MKEVTTELTRLIQGDCLKVLPTLPEDSVHLCVTSPPYLGLRDYKVEGQIGLEATPAEFVRAMVSVFRGVKRVLRDDGTLWLNLGDSFAGTPSGKRGVSCEGVDGVYARRRKRMGTEDGDFVDRKIPEGVKEKDLMGVPWAVAEALKADGWILRGEIIWHKLSAMPESVSGWRWEKCRKKIKGQGGGMGGMTYADMTERDGGWTGKSHPATREKAAWEDCPGCKKCDKNDGLVLRKGSWRPTRAHEVIFLFAKTPTYFCDADAVRTPLATSTVGRDKYSRVLDDPDEQFAVKHDHETVSNQAGANLRDVVNFKGEPLREGHYAAFPSGLPKLAIRAGTSAEGVCPACGAPWCRVVRKTPSTAGRENWDGADSQISRLGRSRPGGFSDMSDEFLGWRPTCDCPKREPVPATVLDPFAGSGTTLMAAAELGRKSIGIELSPEYVKIAAKRARRGERKKGFGFNQ